jgi:hypothetical protein
VLLGQATQEQHLRTLLLLLLLQQLLLLCSLPCSSCMGLCLCAS